MDVGVRYGLQDDATEKKLRKDGDEPPFNVYAPDPRRAFVVYSSNADEETCDYVMARCVLPSAKPLNGATPSWQNAQKNK